MYVNRTPVVGLPQYEGSDKLQRMDMNAAYQMIDAAAAARPAADEEGKYLSARLADQAAAAAPGGILDTQLAAILNSLRGKAELGEDGRLKEGQIPAAEQLPVTALPGLEAENLQQALCMLAERFDASGRAKDALALGGVSAQTVLRGLSVPSAYTDFYEWANTQEHSGAFEIGPHMKTGVPFSDSYYSGYIEVSPSGTKRVMLTYRTGTKASYGSTFVSTYSSGEWKPWVPFAMQYDVIENPPLSNSSCVYQSAFSGETSRLCRTGNMVAGNFSIKFNAQVSAWTDILLLPAGFRPAARYTTVAVGGSNFYRAVCYHSGNLQFDTAVPENTLMSVNCIWLI